MGKIKIIIGTILMILTYLYLLFAYILPLNMYAGKGDGMPYVFDMDAAECLCVLSCISILCCVVVGIMLRKKVGYILMIIAACLNIYRIITLVEILNKVDQGLIMGR